jgi:hypothetical protein
VTPVLAKDSDGSALKKAFRTDAGCSPKQNWRLTGAAGDNILPLGIILHVASNYLFSENFAVSIEARLKQGV